MIMKILGWYSLILQVFILGNGFKKMMIAEEMSDRIGYLIAVTMCLPIAIFIIKNLF